MVSKEKFIHTTQMEELKKVQAIELANLFCEVFEPTTAIDVGCGTGSLIGSLKNKSVSVVGIDGSWVNKELLLDNISEDEFIERDLEKPLDLEKKADIAICLEVAEHLSGDRAVGLVKDLTSLSDVVIFSAAIPGQGGQNHINEQWPNYWKNKFENCGFFCQDILKSRIWNNEKILWWYRQNILVFTRNKNINFPEHLDLKVNPLDPVIHPNLFTTFSDYREKNAVKRYTKLLYKSILYKLNILK